MRQTLAIVTRVERGRLCCRSLLFQRSVREYRFLTWWPIYTRTNVKIVLQTAPSLALLRLCSVFSTTLHW